MPQPLILEGRMDVVTEMSVDLGVDGWREGNRNLRQVKSMASISLAKYRRTHLLWKTQVTIKENKNILIASHCYNYFLTFCCVYLQSLL